MTCVFLSSSWGNSLSSPSVLLISSGWGVFLLWCPRMIPHHTQLRSSLASREYLLPIPKYSLLMAPVPVENPTREDIFLWSGLLPGLFSPWTSVLCHLPFQWKWWTLAFSMPVTKQPPSHPPATETPSGLLWASVLTEMTILVSLKSVGHSPRSCCCWLNAF